MFKDIRILCTECHSLITYADKYGLSLEEAIAQKQAITILKEKKDKTWLECHNITPARNQKERRVQIVKKLLDGGSFIESNNKGGGSK